MKKWIIVANRTQARIFNAEGMLRIAQLKNSLGREKNRVFTSAKPGMDRNRSHSRASTHALNGEKNPHDLVAADFARKLSHFLKDRYEEHHFESFLLSAEPRMLGWIKEEMNNELKKHGEWEHHDLANLTDHELRIRFFPTRIYKERMCESPSFVR